MTKDEISQSFNEGYMKGYQACKEALDTKRVCENEAQPVQEPMAFIYQSNSGHPALMWNSTNTFEYNSITASQPKIPLYTHPAQSWQPLSDEEIEKLANLLGFYEYISTLIEFVRTIEKAHGIE